MKLPPHDDDQVPAPQSPTRGREESDTAGSQPRDGVDRRGPTTWTIDECVVHREQLPDQA
jgi:hypothetical protein